MGDPVKKVMSVDELLDDFNSAYATPKVLDPWGYESVDPDAALGKTKITTPAPYKLPELAPDQTILGHTDLMPDPGAMPKPHIINIKNEANQQLMDLNASRQKLWDDFTGKYPMKQVGGLRGQKHAPVSEKDRPQFEQDYKEFQKQLKVFDAAGNYLDKVAKLPEDRADFWDYFNVYGKEFLEDVTTVGYAAMLRAAQDVGPARRVSKGEGSEADKVLLKAKGLLDLGEGTVDRGPGYRFAGMAAQTIPFMESLAATGGVGIGSTGVKEAFKKGGTLAATGAAAKYLGKQSLRGAIRAPILPQTRSMEYMAGNVVLDENNDWVLDKTTMDAPMKAFAKGTYQNWTAFTSETVGELFGGGLTGGILRRTGLDKKLIPAWFRTATKAIGLHSMEGEITEEFINNVMDAPINHQSFIEALTTDAWDTIWMTGLFTGILGASAGPGVVVNARTRATNMKVIDLYGKDTVSAIRQAMENGDKDSFNSLVAKATESLTGERLKGSGFTREKAEKELARYASSLAMQMTYDNMRETGDAVIEEEDKAGKNIDPRIEAINELGRHMIFGDVPLQDNPNPVMSFADTKLGDKMILLREGENGVFTAYDYNKLKESGFDFGEVKPTMVNATDILERKDVPYQQWLQDELAEMQATIQAGQDIEATIESPYQAGQQIDYQGKKWLISEVNANGLVADEITEEGIPGQSIEISNEELSNIAKGPGEAPPQPVGTVPQQPQARKISDGKNEYTITPFEDDGTMFNVDKVWNVQKEAETAARKLGELYPKIDFTVRTEDSGDVFTPDTYTITASIKLKYRKNDQKNQTGVQGSVREGQTPQQAEPVGGSGTEASETNRVLQTQGEVKQLWEIPLDEYVKTVQAGFSRTMRPEYGPILTDKAKDEHKKAVAQAVSEGKPVPEKVLADYPELRKEEQTEAQEETTGQEEVSGAEQAAVDLIKANDQVDVNPTEGQKEAGNYQKGHLQVQGFDISIENPVGSVRKGTAPDGTEWAQMMRNSYGYFRRTEGKDGDQVDVFLGDKLDSPRVFVVDQVSPETGLFDEHKVMLGFESLEEAKDGYLNNYEPGWKGMGAITEMPMEQFKQWLGNGTRTRKPVDASVRVKEVEKKPSPKSKFKPQSRTSVVLGHAPQDFTEAVMHFFVGGGKIKRDDFIRHTGYKGKDLNTYFGLLSNTGQKLDTFSEAIAHMVGDEHLAGIERQFSGAMDMTNEVIEIMQTFPSKGRMLKALEVRYDISQEGEEPGEEEMAADATPDVPVVDLAPQAFDNLVDEIMASKELMNIFTSAGFLDDNGNLIWERISGILAKNEGFFTQFPYGLNDRELENLKQLTNDTAQQRILGERLAERNSNKSQGEGNITDGGPAADQGRGEIPETAETPTGGTAEVTPQEKKPETKPEDFIRDHIIIAKPSHGETEEKPAFGSTNTVFTQDAAEKAREILRRKLGNLNVGIDPETMQAGITLAGYYIEAGSRKFADYAKKMVADMGEAIKPYLKSFYNAVRDWPGFNAEGMDSYDTVSKTDLDETVKEEAPAVETQPEAKQPEKPAPAPKWTPGKPVETNTGAVTMTLNGRAYPLRANYDTPEEAERASKFDGWEKTFVLPKPASKEEGNNLGKLPEVVKAVKSHQEYKNVRAITIGGLGGTIWIQAKNRQKAEFVGELFPVEETKKPEPKPEPKGETEGSETLIGEYKAPEGFVHEQPQKGIEGPFKRDLTAYSKKLAAALGWEHNTDKKGNPEYSSINIAPAGGDGRIVLWKPNTEYGVEIYVPVEPDEKDVWRIRNGSIQIKPILYRSISKSDNKSGANQWASATTTVGEFAALINKLKGPQEQKPGGFFRETDLLTGEVEEKPRKGPKVFINIIKAEPEEKKPESDVIFERATEDFNRMIANSKPEDIEQARNGFGIAAAKFAVRYIKPEQDQDLYNRIYSIYFDYFRAKETVEQPTPRDGWRDNLIKARDYAAELLTHEELDNLRKEGTLDWADKDSIVRAIDNMLAIKDLFSKAQAINKTPQEKLADIIKDAISRGAKITNTPMLVAKAEEAGMKAGVDYKSVKELYDIASLALNKFIIDEGDRFNPAGKSLADAKHIVIDLESKLDLLPTETQRSQEQVDLQQFSTPPALAFLVNWTAGVNQNDNVLEPSAGEGNIAVFSHLAGASVMVNEYDENRIALLKQLPFSKVTQEDAKHIHAVDALKDIKISVVVMNPPFSRDVALGGKMDLHGAEKHIDAALSKLEPGGRLVAIVGRGMSMNSPTHKDWWDKIEARYQVRANIAVSGDAYSKKGTNFDNRIIVIDKIEPDPLAETVINFVKNYSELADILNLIPKNIRKFKQESDQNGSTTGSSQKTTEQVPRTTGQKDVNVGSVNVPGVQRGNAGPSASEHVRPAGPGTGSLVTNPLSGKGGISNVTPSGPGSPGGNRPGTRQGEVGGRTKGDTDHGRTGQRNEGEPGPLPESTQTVRRTISGTGLSLTRVQKNKAKHKESVGYENYSPEILVEGAKDHPTQLVESAAMASVSLPETDYIPDLSKETVDNGILSKAQLEDIILAGNAHRQMLPSNERRGFFLGAGTGYGKGRTIAGILLDNWNRGSRKAIWISKNEKAHRDSATYWQDVGGDTKVMFAQKNAKNPIKQGEGILMTTYGTLRSGFEPKKKTKEEDKFWTETHENRVQQFAQWLGKDFDGVIVFDESHEMANAKDTKGTRGMKKASLQALAGVQLQFLLPKAKIVYSSATGATEVGNLVYAQRLGLWGDGTPFDSPDDFINAIEKSGVAGMEIISKDLKAMGLYTAKTLSYDGVEYKTIQHDLFPEQAQLYDKIADSWQIVLHNVREALESNQANSWGKSAAWSAFWGAHQRFFSQVITTMEMPTLLEDIQKQLDEDKSVVVQIVNTNEAQQNRSIAEAKAESEGKEIDYEDLDMSPKQILIDFLKKSFPVQQYEEAEDENGNIVTKKVFDSEGNPVLNPEAVAKRDALIKEIDQEMTLPESPLDVMINTFGVDNVAEVTGRTRRIVLKPNKDNKIVKQEEPRTDKHAAKDTNDFMDGKKRILIFSKAGGTGASFHSSLSRKNQQQRVHYVLQAGWQADAAIQGFGRSHRSNQRIAPTFKLVTTNLKAQKRFLSSIARRLEQLGALTKGQRDTGGQGIVSGADNLESRYAKQALFQFYIDVNEGKVPGVDLSVLEDQMALKIFRIDESGQKVYNEKVVFDTRAFLNRIMSLRVDLMDKVFDGFIERLNDQIYQAQLEGSYDAGIESVEAENIKVVDEKEMYTDPVTKGKTYMTTFELTLKNDKRDWEQINREANRHGEKFAGFYKEKNSEKVYAIIEQRVMEADGTSVTKVKRMSVVADSHVEFYEFRSKYEKVTAQEAKEIWNKEFDEYPDTRKKTETIVKGLMLPIWNKLPEKINVRRYIDETGKAHLGRFFNPQDIKHISENFKVENTMKYTPDQVVRILNQGGMVRLANGFELRKGTYQSLPVIRVNGANSWTDKDRLTRAGSMFVVTSTMSGRGDFFIPISQAGEVIPKIESLYNVTVIHAEDKDGNFVMAEQKITKPEAPQPIPEEIKKEDPLDEYFGKPVTKEDAIKEIQDLFTGVKSAVTPVTPKAPEQIGNLEYIEQKHSKTGETLYTVKINERVSRSEYESLKSMARRYGGKYSSYNKEGMKTGFLFRSKENALKFIESNKPITGPSFRVTEISLADQITDLRKKIRDINKAKEAKKAELAQRLVSQKSMFPQEGPKVTQGAMFTIPLDASIENIRSIVSEYDRQLEGMYDALRRLEATQATAAKENEGQQTLFRITDEVYFSPVEKALGAIQQNKATPQQWKVMLLKNGAKQVELDWMGFDDFFMVEGGIKSWTREDLQQWIDQNKIQIKELTYGGLTDQQIDKRKQEIQAEFEHQGLNIETFFDDLSITRDGEPLTDEELDNLPEDLHKLAREYSGLFGLYGTDEAGTKYNQYTMPGGEDYREMLLTMPPDIAPAELLDRKDFTAEFVDEREGKKWYKIYYKGSSVGSRIGTSEDEVIDNYIQKKVDLYNEDAINRASFKSGHWDERNVLAHVRFNSRTTTDGKKVLFIEEIQSDWAQKGKKEGFQTGKVDYDKAIGDFNKKLSDKYNLEQYYPYERVAMRDKLMTDEERQDLERIGQLRLKNNQIKGVPSMPFKQTDQWAGLVLRRMIRYAIDNGFDAVAWTPGDVQRQRYNLATQVKHIAWEKNEDGTYNINAPLPNGDPGIYKEDLSISQVEELVGKDIATKIQNGEGRNVGSETGYRDWTILEGEQLIGGSGMIGFYDQILPSIAGKIGKKFGSQVVSGEIEIGEAPDIEDAESEEEMMGDIENINTITVHTLPITPAMFNAYAQGVPLYRKDSTKGQDLLEDILQTEAAGKRREIEMRGRIELLAQTLNTPITVVNSIDQLPEHIYIQIEGRDRTKERFPGVYDKRTDKVYMVLNEIQDMQEAVKTVIHEVVAHKGLPAVMGREEYHKLLRDVYDWMSEEEASRFAYIYDTNNRYVIASEYIAYLSESGYEPNLWERIVSYIRQWLRRYVKIPYSGVEIKGLLKLSYENLRNQGRPQGKDYTTAGEYLDAMTAWHGSAHNFDRFSTAKIGTGEGNQMFGYGLYFTDKRSIAKFYAASNANMNEYMDKARQDLGVKETAWIEKALARNKWEYTDAYMYLAEKMERFSQDPKIYNRFKRIIQYLDENPLPKNRYLYEVLIGKGKTPDQMDWLDYDKPLKNSQVVKISDQIRKENIDDPVLDLALWDVTPGKKIYELLTKHFGSNQAASSFLSRAGIDGMTYPIGTIQNKSESGKNYVVFNDSGVEIKERYQFRITKPEEPEKLKPKGPPVNILQRKGQKRTELWQNKMLSVREWQNKIRGLGGMITDISNPYRQENLSHGIVKQAIENFDSTLLKSMEQVIADIMTRTGMNYDEMNEYLMAKHAPERNKEIALQRMAKMMNTSYETLRRNYEDKLLPSDQMEAIENSVNSGMETQKARDIVEKYEERMTQEQIDSLWKSVKNATNFALDRWLRDGFINLETYDKIKSMYKYYVPLRNWKQTELDNMYEYQVEDVGRSVNPLKHAKGRRSLADDPMQYIVNMAHSAIVMGEKNRIKQHAARLIRDNPDMKDLHRFKKVYQVWTGELDDEGNKIYDEVYEKPAQELWDQGFVRTKYDLSHTRRRAASQAEQHEVDLWIGGEKYTMVLPADVAAALNKTPSKWDNVAFILRDWRIGQITRWLSSNFTSKNPAFIVMNQMRDVQFAILAHYIKGDTREALDFIKVMPKARRAIIQHIAGKGDLKDPTYKMYRDFLVNGGETGYVHLKDVDEIAAEIKRDLARLTGTNSYQDKIIHGKVLRNLGLWMEHLAVRSENLSRFATFVVAKQQGLSDREAAFRAKEITVNFNRKGHISSLLGSAYAFFNASVQGGETIIRMANEHKGKFMAIGAAGMAMGFLEAVFNGLWGGDDDDGLSRYDTISDYVKFNNFVFMIPGMERYVSVPLPHGFRWFHSLGVLAYQSLYKDEKTMGKILQDGLSQMFSAISPVNPVEFFQSEDLLKNLRPIVPTFLIPFYDIAVNQTYSGAKVHKTPFTQALEGRLADSNLGLDNVNSVAKWFTDNLFKIGGGNPESGSEFYQDEEGRIRPVREIFDLNPSNIEHVIEYYLGGRGMFWNDVLKTSQNVIEAAKTSVDEGPLKAVIKEVNMNEAPVVKYLVRQPWKQSVYTRYYDIVRDIENYKSMVNLGNKAIDPETEMPQYYTPEYQYKMDLLRDLKGDLKSLDEDMEGITDPDMVGEIKDVQERLIRNFIQEATKYDKQ